MSASRNVISAALIMLTAATIAVSQVPQSKVRRAQTQAPAVSTTTVQSQVATQEVVTPVAATARLGQQRRLTFERARVLAGTTATGTLKPDFAQCMNIMQQHPSDGATSAKPGFGTQAGRSGPYVEEHFADGIVLYRFSRGTVVAPPNASAYDCGYQVMAMEVPKAAPPAIPADDSQQAKWARYHNSQLRGVISRLVHDEPTMVKIDQAADEATGGDLFKTTDFLTGVAEFYAGNAP